MSEVIDIFIADDHPIVRQGFIRIIERDEDFRVIGQSGDGDEALRLIESLQPKIAVLDVSMPGKTGLDIVRHLSNKGPAIEFVILTMYKDQEYFDEALELGVKGYVLKESAINDLLSCLREVHRGRHYISPTISGYLINRGVKQPQATVSAGPLEQLTASERRVLSLIAENRTSREIADALFISFRTVQNHRFNICRKLGLKGHNRLLQFAIENKSHWRD